MTGMMCTRRIALASAVAVMPLASPAAATEMVATFRGIVSSGDDNFYDRRFGGGSLAGKAFEAVFTYDTDFFSRDLNPKVSQSEHTVWGLYTLTIDGKSTGRMGEISVELWDEYDYNRVTFDDIHYRSGFSGTERIDLGIRDPDNFVNTLSPTQVINISPTQIMNYQRNGYFYFRDGSSLYLQTNYVSIAPAVAAVVPEPASWALMLAGFGMIGGTLRVRRRQVTFT